MTTTYDRREALRTALQKDLAWLRQQPACDERFHIASILMLAPDMFYPKGQPGDPNVLWAAMYAELQAKYTALCATLTPTPKE